MTYQFNLPPVVNFLQTLALIKAIIKRINFANLMGIKTRSIFILVHNAPKHLFLFTLKKPPPEIACGEQPSVQDYTSELLFL